MMQFLRSAGARTGLFFGATSGVITTIGLLVGLNAGTGHLAAVLGGILVIAVADAMSDAMGIHLAEEANPESTTQQVWTATLFTFVTKFVFASSFAIPLLLLPLQSAVMASLVWGMLVISVLSYFLAKAQNEPPARVIVEHVSIAIVVVVLSRQIGAWVGRTFG